MALAGQNLSDLAQEDDKLIAESMASNAGTYDNPPPLPPPSPKPEPVPEPKPAIDDTVLRLRASIGTNEAVPDTHAKALAYAQTLGLPVEAIQDDLPWAEKQIQSNKYDIETLQQTAPGIAKWLTDPHNVAISSDEIDRVKRIQELAGQLERRGANDTPEIRDLIERQAAAQWNDLQDFRVAVNDPNRVLSQSPSGLDDELERHPGKQVEAYYGNINFKDDITDQLRRAYGLPSLRANEGIFTSFARNTATGGMRLVSAILMDPALTREADFFDSEAATRYADPSFLEKLSGGVGGSVPMMATLALTRGRVAAPAVQMLGRTMTPERLKALSSGINLIALETGALSLAQNVQDENQTPSEAILNAFLESAFTRAGGAFEPFIKGSGAKAGLARAIGGEVLEEGATSASQDVVTQTLGKEADAKPYDIYRTFEAAGMGAAVGTVFAGTYGIPRSIAHRQAERYRVADHAVRYSQGLQNLAEHLEGMKTTERSPERIQDAVEQTLGQGSRLSYLQAADFQAAFPTKEDALAAAEKMGIADVYNDSLTTSSPMAVETSSLVVAAAQSKEVKTLLANVTDKPGGMTATDAETFIADSDKEMKKLRSEAKSQVDAAQSTVDPKVKQVAELEQEIFDNISNAAPEHIDRGALRDEAKIIATTYGGLAELSGKTPKELYSRAITEGVVTPASGKTSLGQQSLDGLSEEAKSWVKTLPPAEQEALAPSIEYFKGNPDPAGDKANLEMLLPSLRKKIAKGKTELNQAKGSNRASISFDSKKGLGRLFTINFGKAADVSSFLHEEGHALLETMSDLAREDGATDAIKAEYEAVQKWFANNVKDIRKQSLALAREADATQDVIDQIKAMSDEQVNAVNQDLTSKQKAGTAQAFIRESAHEYFARTFEKYLFSGKAPTVGLRKAFARMAAWVKVVYKNLKSLNVNMSPDIVSVFDRIIAADEATLAAEEQEGMDFALDRSLFESDAEYNRYLEAVTESKDATRGKLVGELLQHYTAESKRALAAYRGDLRDEVAQQVNAMPVYQAIAALQRGQLPDGTALQRGQLPDGTALPDDLQGIKLDYQDLVTNYGKDRTKDLPGHKTKANSGNYMYIKTGGMPVAQVGKMFGYNSGDEFLTAMATAQDRTALIESETDARMREMRPDLLESGNLAERASQALATDKRSELLWREMSALGRKTGQTSAPVEVMRQIAQDRIGEMRAYTLNPNTFRVGAAKAERATTKAILGQDFKEAYRQKQRALLNLELYRAAAEAKEAADKGRSYVKSFETLKKQQEIGKAGGWEWTVFDRNGDAISTHASDKEAKAEAEDTGDGATYKRTNGYIEQIDAILEGYDLKRPTKSAILRRESLAKWVAKQEALGNRVNVPDEVVRSLGTKNWNELTVNEQEAVTNSVRSIETLARLKNELLKASRERNFESAKAEIIGGISEFQKRILPREVGTGGVVSKAIRGAKFVLDAHRRDSFLARRMDGHKDGGIAWNYFIRPRNLAAAEQETQNKVEGQAFSELFTKWGKKLGAFPKKIKGTDISLTMEERLAVALNYGNKEGRQRLMVHLGLSGHGPSDAQAIIDSLDESDWQLVDGMLGLINKHWSDISALELRTTGISPDKVEALPFRAGGKVRTGGYYPIKYDQNKSFRYDTSKAATAAKDILKATGARAQTKHGHTKIRAIDVAGLALRLDVNVASQHISEVIHDLTHREMGMDQAKLLTDQEIGTVIQDRYGKNAHDQLSSSLEAILQGDQQTKTVVDRIARALRMNYSAAVFGFNFLSAAINTTGLIQSTNRVGVHYMAEAVAQVGKDAKNMENSYAWVCEKSSTMKGRGVTFNREVAEAAKRISPGGGLATMRQASYVPMAMVQKAVDTITWIGAYNQSLDRLNNEGKTIEEAEALAIDIADQTVIDTQGSGRIGDLAAVQRGGELAKVFTAFYSYFGVVYNLQAAAINRFADKPLSPGSIATLAAATMVTSVLPMLADQLLRSLMKGDDREPEEIAKDLISSQVAYGFGMMVGLREASGVLESGYGYSGPAGTSGLGAMVGLVQQANQLEADKAFLKSAVMAGGVLFGVPAVMINRSVDALWSYEEEGDGGEALRQAMFGARRK